LMVQEKGKGGGEYVQDEYSYATNYAVAEGGEKERRMLTTPGMAKRGGRALAEIPSPKRGDPLQKKRKGGPCS